MNTENNQGRHSVYLSNVPEETLEIFFSALTAPSERVAVALMDGMDQLKDLGQQFREIDEFIARIDGDDAPEDRLKDEANKRLAVVGGLLQLPYLRHFDHAALHSGFTPLVSRQRAEDGREALITGMTALAGALVAADFRRAVLVDPLRQAINIQLAKHPDPLALRGWIYETTQAASALEAANMVVARDKIAEMMCAAVETGIRLDRLKVPDDQVMLPYGGAVALPKIAETILAIARQAGERDPKRYASLRGI